MNSSKSENTPMDRDEMWLEQFARSTSNEKSDGDADMTRALRAAMVEHYEAGLNEHDQCADAALQKLLARCRHEELLHEKSTPWWSMQGMPAMAAAMVILVVAAYSLIVEEAPPEKVFRGHGDASAIQQLVRHPMQFANALQRELQAAGIEALVYQKDENWIVQANVKMPANDEVRALLRHRGLQLPDDGALKVVIHAP